MNIIEKVKIWKKRILLREALFFGFSMYVFMTIVVPLIKGEEITLKELLIGIPVWLIGGCLFSLLLKKRDA